MASNETNIETKREDSTGADDGLLDEGSNPQRKCGGCHISGSKEHKLSWCSRCRSILYCSRECQVRDWKFHKRICSVNQLQAASLAVADLAQIFNKPGLFNSIPLPPNITYQQLDLYLENWVKFHSNNLMAASLSALNVHESITRAKTHILNLHLRFNQNQNQGRGRGDVQVGKCFIVEKTEILEQNEAKNKDEAWKAAMEQLKMTRIENEKRGRGTVVAVSLECSPLAVQIVPFGSITTRAVRNGVMTYEKNWEEILKNVVKDGFQMFGVGPR